VAGPTFHRYKAFALHDPQYGDVVYYDNRDYYVEMARPYFGVNPFTFRSAQIVSRLSNAVDKNGDPVDIGVQFLTDNAPDLSLGEQALTKATNKAYAKLQGRMKDSAQNANNILEMKDNISAITSKAKAIADSARAVRRGDLYGAASALGVTLTGSKYQRIKKRAKQAADAWLEFHFGWEPLVQDIGSSIDVLQGTGKSGKSGNGSNRSSSHASADFSDFKDLSFHQGDAVQVGSDSTHGTASIQMSALCAVSNDNLALANQMGFVNPASVLWEAVPFSFVVDWFSNVGQCLSAMTDDLGFNITNARSTVRITGNRQRFTNLSSNDPHDHTVIFQSISTKAIHHSRSPGIAGPTLEVGGTSLGVARGATAISLLVQQLSKLKS